MIGRNDVSKIVWHVQVGTQQGQPDLLWIRTFSTQKSQERDWKMYPGYELIAQKKCWNCVPQTPSLLTTSGNKTQNFHTLSNWTPKETISGHKQDWAEMYKWPWRKRFGGSSRNQSQTRWLLIIKHYVMWLKHKDKYLERLVNNSTWIYVTFSSLFHIVFVYL